LSILFSARFIFRADLTANGDFSLSPVSQTTAAQLDDVVNIKAYFYQKFAGAIFGI